MEPKVNYLNGDGYYISRKVNGFWQYLKDDLTWHDNMYIGVEPYMDGGTYFSSKDEAEELLKKYNEGVK